GGQNSISGAQGGVVGVAHGGAEVDHQGHTGQNHHDERGQDIGGQRRGQGGAQTGAEQSRSSGGNDDLTVDRDLACIGNGRRGRTESGAEFIGAQQRGQRRVGGGDQESGQQQQAPSPDDGVDPARGYGHQQEQTEDLKVHVSVDEGRGRTD